MKKMKQCCRDRIRNVIIRNTKDESPASITCSCGCTLFRTSVKKGDSHESGEWSVKYPNKKKA